MSIRRRYIAGGPIAESPCGSTWTPRATPIANGAAFKRCKQGDWIVCKEGDIDSVDAEVFTHTDRQVGPGLYLKVTPLWDEQAVQDGSIATHEGVSHDKAGHLVFNDPDGGKG